MRLFVRFALAVAILGGWAQQAAADDWGDVAVVSRTLGVKADRLCLGEGTRHDIGCPDYAPYVNPVNSSVSVSGSVIVEKGRAFMGIGVDGNPYPLVQALGDGSVGYFGYGGKYAMNAVGGATYLYQSTSASQGSPSINLFANRVGVGFLATGIVPSATLHVSGTLRIANGGEVCDVNRAGAIRYASGSFDFCDGVSGWRSLAAVAAEGASLVDRIVSGTSAAVISPNGNVTIRGKLDIVSGDSVVAIGDHAANGTLTRTVAVGQNAAAGVSGTYVVAVGNSAGQSNPNDYGSTYVGTSAGRFSTGNGNVYVGFSSGYSSSATGVVAVGASAIQNNTGVAVTALGAGNLGWNNPYNNVTLLGYGTGATKDNQVVLGNTGVVEVKTAGVYTGAGVSVTGAVSTTGNAYISGTIRLSGSPSDACGPGAYGTVRVINNRLWMCRP